MTPSGAIAFVVLTLVLFGVLPRFRALWRGGEAIVETERFYRRFWPFSDAALQGWLRAQVAILIDFVCIYVAGIGAMLRSLVSPTERLAPELIRLVGLAGLAVMTLIVVSIVLFNAPKRFVIPELRGQRGLVAHWRSSRRGNRPEE